ncbi:toll-like receptor 5 [Simochromis diagramma]|uniref:toll-like receptor 5 n=1 Tax=Simochromis diagramma TaxID=43689 RepID=UPI001A7E6C4F|nr:toll-like receptor 5 [Simochromis diagramma]
MYLPAHVTQTLTDKNAAVKSSAEFRFLLSTGRIGVFFSSKTEDSKRISLRNRMMWTVGLQAVAICVFLQVPGCFPSCLIKGSVAYCGFQNLRSVPPLPPDITHLYLEMNHISEINSTSLSGLEELQVLDLGRQHAQLVIRNHAFSRQKHLRRLSLDFNVGLQLEQQAFDGLASLQILNLDYCSLKESILGDKYLEPLLSLQTLSLFGNDIKRLQPSPFFVNMTHLKDLNLKLNKIDKICESDLAAFQGKTFTVLNLNSVYLREMSSGKFDWNKCGNPFRDLTFQTLDLSSNGFGVGQCTQFFKAIEGTKISHLKMSGHMGRGFSFNNLPDPDHSTFEGLHNSSVLSLDLSKSRIFALQQGVFSSLKEVTIIDISQNKVNQIHRNAFEGLQDHLKVLNLSHNLLGEIYSYTFASLTNLQVLDLSHNHIGALGYQSFSRLPNLKLLYLTGNSLRDLGFPAPLPSLDFLLLNDNKLAPSSVSSISQFASNLMHLDLQDNRLTDLKDVSTILTSLKRLRHLFFGGNRIRSCSFSRRVGLNNLTVLDLHSSSLQSVWAQGKCLNLFDNFGHVAGLNLSFNALQSLPQGVFKGLTSVSEMDLSYNALTYIQPDAFPTSLKALYLSNNFIASPNPATFRSLSFLDLRMNRFHCNADLKSFLTWLNETNVTLLSPVEELRCEFPASVYNVPLIKFSAKVSQQ